MPTIQETTSLLNQVRKLTSSPPMTQNPVSAFIARPDSSASHVVTFNLASSKGVASVDLLSSPYPDPGSAAVVHSSSPDQSSYTYNSSASSPSGAMHYWVRLNPQGTSGKPMTIGPQKVTLAS